VQDNRIKAFLNPFKGLVYDMASDCSSVDLSAG
jgi:hypothetical protein